MVRPRRAIVSMASLLVPVIPGAGLLSVQPETLCHLPCGGNMLVWEKLHLVCDVCLVLIILFGFDNSVWF